MKKILYCIVALTIFFPFRTSSYIISPYLKITINKTSEGQDGNFNFDIKNYIPVALDWSDNLNIQTVNGQGLFTKEYYSGSNGIFYITENLPDGWRLKKVICTSTSPSIVFEIIPNGVRLQGSAYNSVNCTFVNTDRVVSNPVLIVPGVIGTELYSDEGLIWPNLGRMLSDINDQFLTENISLDSSGGSENIVELGALIQKQEFLSFELDIFKSLIDNLKSSNYTEDQNLFFFPYDWRLDLDKTKDQLKQKIEAVKLLTGSPKVDVVAHSMGGLLVKDYLYYYGKDSVDKLIFVGTPHLGAPKAAKILLEGDRFSIPWLEEDRIRDIAENSPALHELMPNQTYFSFYQGYFSPFKLFGRAPFWNYDETKSFFINDKDKNSIMFQKAESFFTKHLENMDFSGIKTYNIAGCKTATQAGYSFGIGNYGIGGVGYSSGDQTVPLVSADYVNIPAENKFYLKGGVHAELPSQGSVRGLILELLKGENPNLPSDLSRSRDFCNFKGTTLSWHSPVEVHVYDSQRRHTGPTVENAIEYGIPGVDYDVLGEEKFIYLPTDEGQQYYIDAQGLANSTFDLQISKLSDGEAYYSQVFDDVPITTQTAVFFPVSGFSTGTVLSLDIDGDGENIQAVPPTQVWDPNRPADTNPPLTTVRLEGLMGKPGYYRSKVEAVFEAVDPEVGQGTEPSGWLETWYKVNDGEWSKASSVPVAIESEGLYKLDYYSTDRDGNKESPKTEIFYIDKKPPEASVFFDLKKNDLVFSGIDEISTSSLISVEDKDGGVFFTDEAGNITKLVFNEKNRKKSLQAELKSIEYNRDAGKFGKNKFGFAWKYDKKGQLKSLSQYAVSKKGFKILAVYDGNNTFVAGWDNGKMVSKSLKGLVLLKISTREGDLTWSF